MTIDGRTKRRGLRWERTFQLLTSSVLTALLITAAPSVAANEPAPSPQAPTVPAAARALEELHQWAAKHGGRVSVDAVELGSDRSLLSQDPTLALNPASNMKVLTAAAALDMLGPHFKFQTGLYGDVTTPRMERVVLRGHGDPSLTEASLWRLANALAQQGVRSIGSVLVDQSDFDNQFTPPGFEQQPDEWASFRAPISAIAFQRNSITLHVAPSQPGQPARAWFEPSGILESSGQVETTAAGRGQAVQWQLTAEGGKLVAKLGGRVAAGLPRQRFTRRLDDPRLAPGQNLAAHLKTLGVTVDDVALGGHDVKSRITYVESPPLSELVHELGKHSDNFYAEMLFKALATAGDAHPKSSAAAARVVSDWLQKQGGLTKDVKLVNGSGLFDTNRLSARSLTAVLSAAYDSPRVRSEFVSHLAIGGVDGTLRSRFRALAQQRSIRAKTGTLRNVISLSGYVLKQGTANPVAFAILVNDVNASPQAIRRKVDAIVEALAR